MKHHDSAPVQTDPTLADLAVQYPADNRDHAMVLLASVDPKTLRKATSDALVGNVVESLVVEAGRRRADESLDYAELQRQRALDDAKELSQREAEHYARHANTMFGIADQYTEMGVDIPERLKDHIDNTVNLAASSHAPDFMLDHVARATDDAVIAGITAATVAHEAPTKLAESDHRHRAQLTREIIAKRDKLGRFARLKLGLATTAATAGIFTVPFVAADAISQPEQGVSQEQEDSLQNANALIGATSTLLGIGIGTGLMYSNVGNRVSDSAAHKAAKKKINL